jgi:hypothetical protein
VARYLKRSSGVTVVFESNPMQLSRSIRAAQSLGRYGAFDQDAQTAPCDGIVAWLLFARLSQFRMTFSTPRPRAYTCQPAPDQK